MRAKRRPSPPLWRRLLRLLLVLIGLLALGYRNLAALMDEWNPVSPYDAIYRLRYDGTENRRLTYDDHHNHSPRWTSDGRDILFHDSRYGS